MRYTFTLLLSIAAATSASAQSYPQSQYPRPVQMTDNINGGQPYIQPAPIPYTPPVAVAQPAPAAQPFEDDSWRKTAMELDGD